ncbi:MAG: hypothetical protein ABR956_09095 [Terracidiphilus sp.]|jgi:hypothetical protein
MVAAAPIRDLKMRVISIATLLLVSFLPISAQVADSPDRTSNSNGSLSAETLSNEDLGVILHYPSGWTASETFQDGVLFDPNPDALVNRCTHIQLRAQAPADANGGFVSWGILAVLDRRCIKVGRFPKSIDDRRAISEFSRAIFEVFKRSPFIPPSGMDWGADLAQDGRIKQVTVRLTGKTTLSAFTGHSVPQSGDTQIDTMISIAEVKNRLILWASISDPATTERLKAQPIELWHK